MWMGINQTMEMMLNERRQTDTREGILCGSIDLRHNIRENYQTWGWFTLGKVVTGTGSRDGFWEVVRFCFLIDSSLWVYLVLGKLIQPYTCDKSTSITSLKGLRVQRDLSAPRNSHHPGSMPPLTLPCTATFLTHHISLGLAVGIFPLMSGMVKWRKNWRRSQNTWTWFQVLPHVGCVSSSWLHLSVSLSFLPGTHEWDLVFPSSRKAWVPSFSLLSSCQSSWTKG